jgi:putative transposase
LKQFEEEANQSQKHKTYKFWQVGNHAIEIYSLKFTWEKINYIHNNPVKAGLVTESYYWRYSSASNYQDMESVLEVEKISQMLLTF